MDKEKAIANYLYDNFDPEKPFNDVFPEARWEWHEDKCKEVAADIMRILEGKEPKKKKSIPCDTGPK